MKRYFNFTGTLSQAELLQGLAGMCATGLLLGLVAGLGSGSWEAMLFFACFIPIMGMLTILLPLWISMRLRDAGHSPYWAIACVMPPFMVITLIVAIFRPSVPRPQ